MTLKEAIVSFIKERNWENKEFYSVELINWGFGDYMEEVIHPTRNESLDYENAEIFNLDLETETFEVVAGGDWQDPVHVKFIWKNNKLEVVPGSVWLYKNHSPVYNELSGKQIKKLVGLI
jgi:hypothetical protein